MAGHMQFPLTLFWYSLILVHRVILYQSVLRLYILFIYRDSMVISTESEDQYRKLGSKHLYDQMDYITTQRVSVGKVFQI